MEKDEILNKLQEIFIDLFDDEDIKIDEDTTSKDIQEWDSLSQINLVCALEEDFDIRFTLDELQKLNDIKSILDIISLKSR